MKQSINKLTQGILAVSLIAGSFSCDNNFDEINTDPGAFETIDESLQFNWVIRRMTSESYETWRGNLIYASEWVQHLAGTWGPDQYDVTNEDWASAQWNTTYIDYLKNMNDIIDRMEENSNRNLIARTIRVFFMQRLTDLHGDIPYSEAGMNIENLFPVYDRQQDIYASFVTDLTAAIDNIDVTNTSDTFDEPIYNGKLTKWKKFAASLLLKVGMRMSEVDAAAAQSAVSAALTAGVFESNDDIAYVEFGDLRNGISSVFQDFGVEGHGFSYSDEFVTRLQDQNDPRIPILMANYDNAGEEVATVPSAFIGRENGSVSVLISLTHAQPHRTNMVDYQAPRLLFTFAETEFLKAEARLRGWASGSAAEAYNSGITAACKQLDLFVGSGNGVSDVEITALLAEPSVVYNAATGLEQIITQKWIALIFNGYEAYAEYRRTGFPILTPGITQGTSDGTIPDRMRYPLLELTVNGTNYQDALSRYGGTDNINAKVWWDVD